MNSADKQAISLNVALGDRSYPILIGRSLLADVERLISYLPSRRVALVTNETIYPLYGESLTGKLRQQDIAVLPICLQDGEQYKGWPALNQI